MEIVSAAYASDQMSRAARAAARSIALNPPAVQVLWKYDEIQIGNTAITAALANDCARHVDSGNTAKLPTGFDMLENEVVIISEVCSRLTVQGSLTGTFVDGDIYRVHAIPASSRRSGPEPDKVT